MKKLIIFSFICLAGMMAIGIYIGYKCGQYAQQQIVQLPEEIPLVSTDKNKPDTLIGYQINGVIIIGFKHEK